MAIKCGRCKLYHPDVAGVRACCSAAWSVPDARTTTGPSRRQPFRLPWASGGAAKVAHGAPRSTRYFKPYRSTVKTYGGASATPAITPVLARCTACGRLPAPFTGACGC